MAAENPIELKLRIPDRRSWVRCPPGEWTTVQAFLAERFAKQGDGVWALRMAMGQVHDETGQAVALGALYQAGQLLSYLRAVPQEFDQGLRASIVYQDAHLLVADKPHFMPVTPGGEVLEGSLLIQLQRITGLADLQPLHRIDAETAGLVAFCVRKQDRGAYQALFKDRLVSKTYLAVSQADVQIQRLAFERSSRIEADPAHFMRMREVAGEPNAISRIECMGVADGAAHWQLRPVSGKRHQLRVHMHALGHPLLNDSIYPALLPARNRQEPLPSPLQLLAAELGFVDPLTAKQHQFASGQRLAHWRLAWPSAA